MYPEQFTNVISGKVILKKFSQLAANTIVLPNIIIGEGAVTGALSLVNKNLEPWTINTGIPINRTRPRKKGLLEHYMNFEQNL